MKLCSHCGNQHAKGRFCSSCGHDVGEATNRSAAPGPQPCVNCGAPLAPEDQFCGRCGTTRAASGASIVGAAGAGATTPATTQPTPQPAPHPTMPMAAQAAPIPVDRPRRPSRATTPLIAIGVTIMLLALGGWLIVRVTADDEPSSAVTDFRTSDEDESLEDDDLGDDAAPVDEPAEETPTESPPPKDDDAAATDDATMSTSTTVPATSPPTAAAPTTAPSTTSPPPTPTTIFGDLVLGVDMARPECDGQYITIIGSAVDSAQYNQVMSDVLARYPGSEYLRTDQTCPSLRADFDGDPIYSAFFGPFVSADEACSARAFGPSDAYVRILSTVDPPTHQVRC